MWTVQAGGIDARGLASVTYGVAQAFAKVGHLEEKLLVALARAAELRLSQFSPQGIANTAWAFVTVGHLDEKLYILFLTNL